MSSICFLCEKKLSLSEYARSYKKRISIILNRFLKKKKKRQLITNAKVSRFGEREKIDFLFTF